MRANLRNYTHATIRIQQTTIPNSKGVRVNYNHVLVQLKSLTYIVTAKRRKMLGELFRQK